MRAFVSVWAHVCVCVCWVCVCVCAGSNCIKWAQWLIGKRGGVDSQLIHRVTHVTPVCLSVGQSLGEKTTRAHTHTRTSPKWRREQILTAWWHSYTESHLSKPNLTVPSVLITETWIYCTFFYTIRGEADGLSDWPKGAPSTARSKGRTLLTLLCFI